MLLMIVCGTLAIYFVNDCFLSDYIILIRWVKSRFIGLHEVLRLR